MFSEQNTFRALAHPTRRAILRLLRGREMTISEITEHFQMTRAAVKKHLVVLKEGGFVRVEVKGRECINHLERGAFSLVKEWVNEFEQPVEDRLGALKRSIAKEWS